MHDRVDVASDALAAVFPRSATASGFIAENSKHDQAQRAWNTHDWNASKYDWNVSK